MFLVNIDHIFTNDHFVFCIDIAYCYHAPDSKNILDASPGCFGVRLFQHFRFADVQDVEISKIICFEKGSGFVVDLFGVIWWAQSQT